MFPFSPRVVAALQPWAGISERLRRKSETFGVKRTAFGAYQTGEKRFSGIPHVSRGTPQMPTELVDLITNLAIDSMNVQLRFNQAHETALKEFETLVAATDPSVRPFLAPLLPARMHLDDFELDLGVAVTKETEVGFSIQALPIGLGFSILHSVRTDRMSRLHVSVQQSPLPEPAQ
jgi:hypothetical protein